MGIDGVVLLSETVITELPLWECILVVLGLVGGGLGAVITASEGHPVWSGICSAAFILAVLLISSGPDLETVRGHEYKCLFDKDVPIADVYEKYEVVGKDGDIWILHDKE